MDFKIKQLFSTVKDPKLREKKTILFHFITNILENKVKVTRCVKLTNKKIKVQLFVAIGRTHSSLHIWRLSTLKLQGNETTKAILAY
jgi:hypothetical protein